LCGQQNLQYEKICFCSGNETPHNVVSFDNNVEVLLALNESKTKDNLKANDISITDSQLKLLQMFNLIDKKGETYYTKIPILDSTQTQELRRQTKEVAQTVFNKIAPQTQNLIEHLDSKYDSNNSFSILFSYVLDGLIWREFKQKQLIQENVPDENTSTWNGHFWMIPFPRESKCGTNTSFEKNTTIYITNGIPWRYMKPLYSNYDLMIKMLSDINDYGTIKDSEVIERFSDYTLFDNKGVLNVPIIYESEENKTYQLSNLVVKGLLNEFLAHVEISTITRKYSLIDNEIALMIFYHEFMWDLMDLFEDNNLATRPQLLVDEANGSLKDMSDLIFFVINKDKGAM
jgi:hypothetical protein